jgi:hypothetical protein
MVKRKPLVVITGIVASAGAFLFLIAAQPSFGDEPVKLQGVWKLISYDVEIQATGQKEPLMGEHPIGYAIFTSEGRAMFIVTAEGRKPATTVQERAGLLNTVVAYTGKYRLDGDKWIVKVEAASNPEWAETEQVRFFKVDGSRLQVMTPWRIMPNWPQKGMTRSILTWLRD